MSLSAIARVRALQRQRDKLLEERERQRRWLEEQVQREAAPTPSIEPVNIDPKDRTLWTPATLLPEYRDKPVQFIGEVLERRLDAQQEDIALALAESDNVAAKSGQKTGKSFLAIGLSAWWVCTRAAGKVTLTSASWDQVKDPLWSELTELYDYLWRSGVKLLPEPPLDPATGMRFGDGRYIRGISTAKRERAAGKSGADQLFIIDECSGLKREIIEAYVGNTLGGGKVLALSQPTEPSGFFFDIFTSQREFWKCFTLSSRKTINYLQKREVIRGLARYEDVNKQILSYGEGSAFVEVRIDGKFPTRSDNAVVSLGMVEGALKRWSNDDPDLESGATLDLGVDVAHFGDDDSAVAARRGLRLFSPESFKTDHDIDAVVHGYDFHAVAGVTLQCMRALRRNGERVRIKVDAAGGYGSAVAEILRKLQEEGETEGLDDFVDIIEINVSEASTQPERYPNLRSEVWFSARDFFQAGGAMASDPRLEAELIAPHYSITPKGQMLVEKKAETKKRIGRSPDRADAALLAIYNPTNPVASMPDQHDSYEMSRWAGFADQGFG
jgi:phage terminase large subunit